MTIGARSRDLKRKLNRLHPFLVALPLVALLLTAPMLNGCSSNDPVDPGEDTPVEKLQDLLPAEISGFTTVGDPVTATAEADQQQIITDDFDEFKSRELQEVVEQSYTGTIEQESDVELTIWLLNMNTATNAAGIVTFLTATDYQELPDIGDGAWGDDTDDDSYTIWFNRGKYVARIVLGSGSFDTRLKGKEIALAIDGNFDPDQNTPLQLLQDFLPGEIVGFVTDAAPIVANTEVDLQEIVNGDFGQYQSHDLQEAVVQTYIGTIGTQSDVDLIIWLLDMSTPTNAAGIVEFLTQTSYQALDGVGDSAWDQTSFVNYDIWFNRDRYAARIQLDTGSVDGKTMALGVAQTIDGKMTD